MPDVMGPERGARKRDEAPGLRRAEQALRAALPVQQVAAAVQDARQQQGPRPSSADLRWPRRRMKSQLSKRSKPFSQLTGITLT